MKIETSPQLQEYLQLAKLVTMSEERVEELRSKMDFLWLKLTDAEHAWLDNQPQGVDKKDETMFDLPKLEKHEEYMTAFAILCDGLIVTHKITRHWVGPRPDPNSVEEQRAELILWLGGMNNRYFESSHYGVRFPSTDIQIIGRIFYSTKDQDGFNLAQAWMASIKMHPELDPYDPIPAGTLCPWSTERILQEGELLLEHPAGEFWLRNEKKKGEEEEGVEG